MSKESSTSTASEPSSGPHVEPVRSLGTSPIGESFEVIRQQTDGESSSLDEDAPQRFVLKKITRARLRSPDQFRQKFAALCRLDHPSLCQYRELYVGEKASRIERDFVEGRPLSEYLFQPITDRERHELSSRTDDHEPDQAPAGESSPEGEPDPPDRGEAQPDIDNATQDERGSVRDDASPEGKTDDANHSVSTEASIPKNGDDRRSASDRDQGPSTLEIPDSLLQDSDTADRALDLIILRLRRVIGELVDALEYLHRFRHIHGHLTPSNIFITDDEQVILTDFGLYPELEVPAEAWRRHTSYHAPEVERGEYRTESDLYALGAILFELLADRRYGARRHRDTPDGGDPKFSPLYLSEIVPHCPASWVDLIHALLAPNPDDRPALDDVHRQLAAMEARSVNIPASAVADEPETLYGRHDNLDTLVGYAKSCSQNRHLGLALVEGETGVGKTALLDALSRRAAQRGWVVLHGRCFHREPIAYQGWEEIAARLTEITDELPKKPQQRLIPGRRRASCLFPQLAIQDMDRPAINRQTAVDGFRQLLRGISEQRPILICFDDIHWAGHDSIRLLADLAEQPQGMRVMIVGTWRPDAVDQSSHPFGTELATAPVTLNRLDMEGFSKEDARNYVRTHADHLSLRQKQKVLRRGGLNPLFIDELIHEFEDPKDSGSGDKNTPQPGETPMDDGDHLDHHLQTFVEHRLGDLSRTQRLVVQLLAVASAPLSAPLLANAMARELGTQTSEVVTGHEVAESLVERRLARRARRDDARSTAPQRYVVVHDLCRRVILEELGQDHHTRLCGLIADALAESDRQNDDLRFEYLLRAGRGQETARAAVLAARASTNRFAYHRATRLWQWLDDNAELEPRDRREFASALLGANHFEEAVQAFTELLPGPSMDMDIKWRRQRVQALLCVGHRSQATTALDEALNEVSIDYTERSALDWFSGLRRRLSATTRRWSDATTLAEDGAIDERTEARAEICDFALQTSPVLHSQAYRHLESHFATLALNAKSAPLLARDRLIMIGEPTLPFLTRDGTKLDRWADQAATLNERVDDPDLAIQTLEMRALLARHRGHFEDAIASLEQAQALIDARDVSRPVVSARILRLHADVSLWLGDFEQASRLIDRLLHRYRHRRWLSVLGELAGCDRELLIGELDSADRRLDRVEQFIGDDRNTLLHLWMMDRRTRLYIAQGQVEVAVAQWDLLLDRVYPRGLRRRPISRLLIHLNLSRSLAALAERQRALNESQHRDSVRRFRRTLRRLSDVEPWMGTLERAELHRLRSRYALLRERPRRALGDAEKAAQALGETPPPVVEAMNREVEGFARHQLEQPDGRTLLTEARARYDELGCFLPLVLEGWPVPRSHARLQLDE